MHATSGTDDKARVGDAFPTLELAAASGQLVTVPDPAAALRNHGTKRGALGPVKPTGGRLGLPADFLIAPDGRIAALKIRTTRLQPVDR